MDWASFGYGAGLLALSWSAWDARDEVYDRLWLWRHRLEVRRAEKRMHRLADLTKMRALEQKLTLLEANTKALVQLVHAQSAQVERVEAEKAKLAAAHKQLKAADKKWDAYTKRRRTNPRLAQIVKEHSASLEKPALPVGPGAASKGTLKVKLGAKNGGNFWVRPGAAKAPRQPQRLDGLGYAGKPGTACGRGMCCLGEGHQAGCTV